MNYQQFKGRFRRELAGPLLLGIFALTHATVTLAVDGVIEINQAKATAGGVTAGDGAGFPVSITESGSYRLTSDLNAPLNSNGVVISVDGVTLDLNGFNLVGGGGSIADGISMSNGNRNIEIKNGTIRGFSRHGVFTNSFTHFIRVIGVRAVANTFTGIELQGEGNLVDGCVALGNSGAGIRAMNGSLVINSISAGNTGIGLNMFSPSGVTGYRSNVLTLNNGGNSNPQTSGGIELGPNVCGNDLVCP